MTVILGLKTQDRIESSSLIQKILTDYGCFVRTRLGLHDISAEFCPNYALILLEIPDNQKAFLIENRLLDVSGVEIQRMIFDFN